MNKTTEKEEMSENCGSILKKECRVFPDWMRNGKQKEKYLKFNGSINLLCTENVINDVCDKLNIDAEIKNRVVGFDCEWDVELSKGSCSQKKVALIQICISKRDCYLFHLSCIDYKMPEKLKDVITNHRILKVGVNVDGDIFKLHRDYEVPSDIIVTGDQRSTLDLSQFANAVFGKFECWSLRGLTEFLLECSLQKDDQLRLSKWSDRQLSQDQIHYAACDAYVVLFIKYNFLKELYIQASLLLFHKIKKQKERTEGLR